MSVTPKIYTRSPSDAGIIPAISREPLADNSGRLPPLGVALPDRKAETKRSSSGFVPLFVSAESSRYSNGSVSAASGVSGRRVSNWEQLVNCCSLGVWCFLARHNTVPVYLSGNARLPSRRVDCASALVMTSRTSLIGIVFPFLFRIQFRLAVFMCVLRSRRDGLLVGLECGLGHQVCQQPSIFCTASHL